MLGPKTIDVNHIVNQIEEEESYREWSDEDGSNDDKLWDEGDEPEHGTTT